VSWVKPSTDAR